MLKVPVKRGSQDYFTERTQPILAYDCSVIGESSMAIGRLADKAAEHTRDAFDVMRSMPSAELFVLLSEAGRIFRDQDLYFGDKKLTPNERDKLVTLSTGLPISTVQTCRQFLGDALENMQGVIAAQMPNNDIGYLDDYVGVNFAFVPAGKNLGVICPSNHPSVNAVWLMAYASKMPVVLKPGSEDLFTPLMLTEALYQAGLPEDSLHYLPHPQPDNGNFVRELFSAVDLGMIFGSQSVVSQYRNNPSIKTYGPGNSKSV
ncbi:aldehyde dehydrogenase family protein, partial [Candidatus Woesearchaeota archaeon]|nr:aldehyde dehydrogenase family protein [Candidatus Woesearchaeota archaeon]